MSELNQDAPEQQAAQTESAPVQQVDWEKRYKGAVTKINQLNETIKNLQAELALKTNDYESLSSQISVVQTERDAAVSERDKVIQQLNEKLAKLEQENKKLSAMVKKVEVIKKNDRPELLKIIQHLPDVDDDSVLDDIIKDFTELVDGIKREREKELLAGTTPPPASVKTTAKPGSHEEWQRYVNSLSGAERQKAMQEWWEWGMKNS